MVVVMLSRLYEGAGAGAGEGKPRSVGGSKNFKDLRLLPMTSVCNFERVLEF